MNEIVQRLLGNAVVVVELAGLPPMSVSLDPGPSDAPPNALLSALRPAITLQISGVNVHHSAPYGDPRQGIPWGVVLVTGAALGAVVVVWAVARGFSRPA